MDPAAWKKHPKPVFASTPDVIAPGHASFTTSLDGKQNWIVYHAAKHKGAGWNRQTHLQPFKWNTDGTPSFGRPFPPLKVLSKKGISQN
jgi:GH43 family beta-xylosidase